MLLTFSSTRHRPFNCAILWFNERSKALLLKTIIQLSGIWDYYRTLSNIYHLWKCFFQPILHNLKNKKSVWTSLHSFKYLGFLKTLTFVFTFIYFHYYSGPSYHHTILHTNLPTNTCSIHNTSLRDINLRRDEFASGFPSLIYSSQTN